MTATVKSRAELPSSGSTSQVGPGESRTTQRLRSLASEGLQAQLESLRPGDDGDADEGLSKEERKRRKKEAQSRKEEEARQRRLANIPTAVPIILKALEERGGLIAKNHWDELFADHPDFPGYKEVRDHVPGAVKTPKGLATEERACRDAAYELLDTLRSRGELSPEVAKRLVAQELPSTALVDRTLQLGVAEGLFERGDEGDYRIAGNQVAHTQHFLRKKAAKSGADPQQKERFEVPQPEGGWSVIGMFEECANDDRARGLAYHDDAQREQTRLGVKDGRFVDHAGEEPKGPDLSDMSDIEVVNTSNNYASRRAGELEDLGIPAHEALKIIAKEIRAMPRVIFVMTASGEFHIAEAELYKVHHSTLLAGKAVAAAGELALSGGVPKYISNASGHYQPSPAYLWQAVKQLDLNGFPMESLEVELFGVKRHLTGAELLENFDPSLPDTEASALPHGNKGVKKINAWIDKTRAREAEEKPREEKPREEKQKPQQPAPRPESQSHYGNLDELSEQAVLPKAKVKSTHTYGNLATLESDARAPGPRKEGVPKEKVKSTFTYGDLSKPESFFQAPDPVRGGDAEQQPDGQAPTRPEPRSRYGDPSELNEEPRGQQNGDLGARAGNQDGAQGRTTPTPQGYGDLVGMNAGQAPEPEVEPPPQHDWRAEARRRRVLDYGSKLQALVHQAKKGLRVKDVPKRLAPLMGRESRADAVTPEEVIEHALAKNLFVRHRDRLVAKGDQVDRMQARMRGIEQAEDSESHQDERIVVEQPEYGWSIVGMLRRRAEQDADDGLRVWSEGEREKNQASIERGRFVDRSGDQWLDAHSPDGDDNKVVTDSGFSSQVERRALIEGGMSREEANRIIAERVRKAPKHIFVMTADGRFLIGEPKVGYFHHSSLAGGLPVAAAGELGLSGGRPYFISNHSGHYLPSAQKLWQAVKQMQLDGVPVATMQVALFGLRSTISGGWFLRNFDPTLEQSDPRFLPTDNARAVARIEGMLGDKERVTRGDEGKKKRFHFGKQDAEAKKAKQETKRRREDWQLEEQEQESARERSSDRAPIEVARLVERNDIVWKKDWSAHFENLHQGHFPSFEEVKDHVPGAWVAFGGAALVNGLYMSDFYARLLQERVMSKGSITLEQALKYYLRDVRQYEQGGPHVELDSVIGSLREKNLAVVDGDTLRAHANPVERLQAGMRGTQLAPRGQHEHRFKVAQPESGWSVIGMTTHGAMMDQRHGVRQNSERRQERAKLTVQDGKFVGHDGQLANGPDLSDMNDQEVCNTSNNFANLRMGELLKQGVEREQAIEMIASEIRKAPRNIFVMTSGGEFLIAEAELFKTHHSTLLAGAPVSAAGEIALSGGKPTYLSDASGHYQPTPAQTWQAVKQIQLNGMSVDSLEVQMFGISQTISGADFLANFDPSLPPGREGALPADSNSAIRAINKWLKQRRREERALREEQDRDGEGGRERDGGRKQRRGGE